MHYTMILIYILSEREQEKEGTIHEIKNQVEW